MTDDPEQRKGEAGEEHASNQLGEKALLHTMLYYNTLR